MKRPLAVLIVVATAALWPGRGQADTDYMLDSRAWNGLFTFNALIRGSGLEALETTELRWDELSMRDILVILYPQRSIEGSKLATFIGNGGRVVIADDFGAAEDAIEQLSMLRSDHVGAAVDTFYDDLEFAPIAKPVAKGHALAHGIGQLTTNHPATLRNVKGADVVFGFSDTEAVVVAGDVNRGRFVVLSDPSVLINRMLEFDGNLLFASNLLRYLSIDGFTKRVVILTGEARLEGQPSGLLDDTGATPLHSQINNLNDLFYEANKYFLTRLSLRVVGVIMALGVIVLALSTIPVRSQIKTDGTWGRARPDAPPQRDFQAVVGDFERPARRQSWALPAAILRDTVASRLSQVTSLSRPFAGLPEADLYSRLADRCGPEAVSALQPLYSTLQNLPTRAQAASTWEPTYFSERDFARLRAGVAALYRTLEASDHGGTNNRS